MNTNLKPFSVRSYGLIVVGGSILLSEEKWFGEQMLKFPGGGVEFGESPVDALKREFREEMNAEVLSYSLFHVSELFFESKFMTGIQVIPIYYKSQISQLPNCVKEGIGQRVLEEGQQIFHLCTIACFDTALMTFESDRVVMNMLKSSTELR